MRRPARDESGGFSLFPFLAVLLCTMGTMVVLLVAMAQVSRDKARQENELAQAAAAAGRAAADSPERRALEASLAEARAAIEELSNIKAEGDRQLAAQQRRLSDIEDHLRRIREEAESLTAETAQLIAVEKEHYDDEKIAAQELERLNRLIGQIEDEIEKARFAAAGRERRYAIKPLRDARTGTLRPPVYFECRSSGVVLQPEGIELTWADLVAADFSSPVGAAQRAVARYYEEHPEARAANELGVPYPLLVVRPDGVHAYYLARTAFEAAGVDYGYQPIAEDWPLEYGSENPVLAAQVAEAIQDARNERQGLAPMIPQLAAALASAESDARQAISRGEGGPQGGLVAVRMGGGGGSSPAGGRGGLRVRPANPESNNPFEGLRIEGSLPGEAAAGGRPPDNLLSAGASGGSGGYAGLTATGPSLSAPASGADGPQASGPAGIAAAASATNATSAGQPQDAGAPNGAPGGSDANATGATPTTANVTVNPLTAPNKAPAAAPASTAQASSASAQGAARPGDSSQGQPAGASRNGRPGVPMIRPIQLYVSQSRVALLPERATTAGEMASAATTTQGVDFHGATSAQINDVIAVLKRHADAWGIAGDGMYWDPRLVLNVASDGAQRADEVRRLLEAAGVKVQAYPITTAANPPPTGDSNATRR